METSAPGEESSAEAAAREETPELYRCLADITKEIRELKGDMKNGLKALNSSFRQEFASFKEDVNNKLRVNSEELQDQKKSPNEVQTRIDELETFSMEAKEALLMTLREQRKLQEKLTDREGMSRRNNVRIFGVPEGEEGDSAPLFVEKLLRRELALPEGTRLLIQRAHRAAVRRPRP